MMKKQRILIGLVALLSALTSGCSTSPSEVSTSGVNTADAIYFGGDIITMEGDSPAYAEALAVKDGKIVFVGTKAQALIMHSNGPRSTKSNSHGGPI